MIDSSAFAVRLLPFTVNYVQAHSTEGRSKQYTCSCEIANAEGESLLLPHGSTASERKIALRLSMFLEKRP